MKRLFMACSLALAAPAALAAASSDTAQLRHEIEQLKADYEQRLQALETRVQHAEAKADAAKTAAASAQNIAATPPPTAAAATSASGTAFNPAVSVILNGTYGKFSRDPKTYAIPGFAHARDADPGKRGPTLGESEVVLSANVDDKFYGNLTAAVTPEGAINVEEGYFQTLTMPASLTAKAGRFFSGIGYLNEQHSHVWDFVDAPLAYRALLGNQYGDDGVQLRWLAPTDTFVELGGELLRGDAFPGGNANSNGAGARSAFVHIGGDVGVSNSWRAGLSQLRTTAENRTTDTTGATGTDTFSGHSIISIADFVWKWSPNGNPVYTNFKLQGEYLRRSEDGTFTPSGQSAAAYSGVQHGAYLQGIYQFMPRWRVGVRHDWLTANNPGIAFANTTLDPRGHRPKRDSLMVDFSNSEFSRLRLQYNRDQSQAAIDNEWYLQYIMSIGAHGAHQF
ncbi:MAG: hypothetical protein ACYDC8_02430 [Gammaproteobacteria bacterium]